MREYLEVYDGLGTWDKAANLLEIDTLTYIQCVLRKKTK